MSAIASTAVSTPVSRRQVLASGVAVLAGLPAYTFAQAPPEATPTDTSGRADLLAMVPASFAERLAPTGVPFTWCDIATQAATVDAAMPTGLPQSISAEFAAATGPLPLGFAAPGSPLEPEVHDRFGFSAATAHEVLSAGRLTIYRGGLPLMEMAAHWESAGYARETTPEGVDIWTIGVVVTGHTGPNVATPPPLQLAIVDDTVVVGHAADDAAAVAGYAKGDVAAVVTQAKTGGPTLINALHYRNLLASLLAETVAVMALGPSMFDVGQYALLQPDDAAQEMDLVAQEPVQVPRPRNAIFGITGGGKGQGASIRAPGTSRSASPAPPTAPDPGDAIVQIRLQYASQDEVAQALTVIEHRWTSWTSVDRDRPYSDLMTIVAAHPDPSDPTIAAIDFRPVQDPTVWWTMTLRQDLLPFAHLGDPSPAATPRAG